MRPLSGGCEATGVVRGGVFYVDDKRTLERKIASLPDGPVLLRIEPALGARSLEDNRRYWAAIQDIAEETGNTPKALHEHYKEKFFVESTTALDSRRFRHYLDQVMADAAIEHGVVFVYPEPLIGGTDAALTPNPNDGRSPGQASRPAEGSGEDREASEEDVGPI